MLQPFLANEHEAAVYDESNPEHVHKLTGVLQASDLDLGSRNVKLVVHQQSGTKIVDLARPCLRPAQYNG